MASLSSCRMLMELDVNHKRKRTHKRFISSQDVADRYGIGVSTVWQWTKDGILPAPLKFGLRCTRWDEETLDKHDEQAKGAT